MYIELHARSAFSFLEGSSLPEDLAGACARLSLSAMALLDTDGVYGAPRFHMAMKKLGIQAHIGAEVMCEYLNPVILSRDGIARSAGPSKSKNPYTRQAVERVGIPRFARNDSPLVASQSIFENRQSRIKIGNRQLAIGNSFRLPLLVSSRAGYQNLCRLITKMKLRAKKGEGAVEKNELEEHANGIDGGDAE